MKNLIFFAMIIAMSSGLFGSIAWGQPPFGTSYVAIPEPGSLLPQPPNLFSQKFIAHSVRGLPFHESCEAINNQCQEITEGIFIWTHRCKLKVLVFLSPTGAINENFRDVLFIPIDDDPPLTALGDGSTFCGTCTIDNVEYEIWRGEPPPSSL